MKIVLVDLGKWCEQKNPPAPDLLDLLEKVLASKDAEDSAPVVIVMADDCAGQKITGFPVEPGLRLFFEPFDDNERLPPGEVLDAFEKRIQAAADTVSPNFHIHELIFMAEDTRRIEMARDLGITGVQFQVMRKFSARTEVLDDPVLGVQRLLGFTSCEKAPDAEIRPFDLQEFLDDNTSHAHIFSASIDASIFLGGDKNHAVVTATSTVTVTDVVSAPADTVETLTEIDPKIKALTDQVSEDRLLRSVTDLTGFGTRYLYADNRETVSSWVFDQFVSSNYCANNEVKFQSYEMSVYPQKNVLCRHPGVSENIVLVCAHYDSLSQRPRESAPGADDNASGVAALLEIARILKNVNFKKKILFIAFAGEELELSGANHCAGVADAENWPIDVVINMDMIGFNPPDQPGKIVIEIDKNRLFGNDQKSLEYAGAMTLSALTYTSLGVWHSDIVSSDYVPFEKKAFPCIGAYNYYKNPDKHRMADTIDKVNFPHLTEVTKMVLATVARIAGIDPGPLPPCDPLPAGDPLPESDPVPNVDP
jgi:Peptidase family M28